MNQAPSLFLRQYLIDCGEAIDSSGALKGSGKIRQDALGFWPVVAGPIPDDGSRYIGILDLIAMSDPKAMNTVLRSEHPRLQFIIRSSEYDFGMNKGIKLQHRFDAVGNPDTASGGLGWIPVTWNGETVTLTAVHVQVPIMPIGMEKDNRRFLFVFHVQMEYRD